MSNNSNETYWCEMTCRRKSRVPGEFGLSRFFGFFLKNQGSLDLVDFSLFLLFRFFFSFFFLCSSFLSSLLPQTRGESTPNTFSLARLLSSPACLASSLGRQKRICRYHPRRPLERSLRPWLCPSEADKSIVWRLSLNRSQWGGCSTKYNTPTES